MSSSSLERKNPLLLKDINRVVIKLGTNLIVDKEGYFKKEIIQAITEEIAILKKNNLEVILVSSGAIGAGIRELNLVKKPSTLCELQATAAVGQLVLLNYYHECFKKHQCRISQVLLSHSDLKDRERHLNARNTLLKLLKYQVTPIINENDVIANEEIKFGDNDWLSALASILLDADLLILLTTPDGLQQTLASGKLKRIPFLERVDHTAFKFVTEKQNALSTGGMKSKLEAANIASKAGILVTIASGFQKNIIQHIINGEDVGTLIQPQNNDRKINKRKQWLSYFHRAEGKLFINKNASDAVMKKGASLLAVGIEKVDGKFGVGSFIKIISTSRKIIAYGLTEYSSSDIARIKGKTSSKIAEILGYKTSNTIVHRNNMIIEKH